MSHDAVFKNAAGTIMQRQLRPMRISCNISNFFKLYVHKPHFRSLSIRMFVYLVSSVMFSLVNKLRERDAIVRPLPCLLTTIKRRLVISNCVDMNKQQFYLGDLLKQFCIALLISSSSMFIVIQLSLQLH